MSYKTPKKRGPKKNGFTQGRPEDIITKSRRKIGHIIIQNYDYRLTKREFHILYQKAISENSDIPDVTKKTIYTDRDIILEEIRESYPDFDFLKNKPVRNTRELEGSANIPISKDLVKNVRNIRIEINGRSFIIYDKKNNTFKQGRSAFINEQLTNINNSLSTTILDSSYMIHLYIIFDVKRYHGVEEYICSFYKDKLNYILYTSSHNYCSEIVTEYSNLELLITDTWKMFKKHFS